MGTKRCAIEVVAIAAGTTAAVVGGAAGAKELGVGDESDEPAAGDKESDE